MGVLRIWVTLFPFLSILALMLSAEGIYPAQTYSVPKKCAHARVHGLIAADCHKMDLKRVPQNLERNIEILDMSFNRIREVGKDSFERYDNIKILYLQENILTRIEEGTFRDLSYIEVINLSMNPLAKFPLDVLYLPNLRKVLIDEVELDDFDFDDLLDHPKNPAVIELSLHMSRLLSFPPLEKFPNVQYLNVSRNYFKTITAAQLAPACFLKEIDLNGNKDLFRQPSCNCTSVEDWITSHNITLVPPFRLACPSMTEQAKEECLKLTRAENERLYNSCIVEFADRQTREANLKMWMVIGAAVAVLLVVLSIGIFCVHRRCRAKRNRGNRTPVDSTNNLDSLSDNAKGEVQKNLLTDHNNV